MYDKIETLAIKASNPNTTEEERKDFNLEFNDYKKQLENLMVSRYNGKLLFSNTLMCGGVPNDIELKELDLANSKGGAQHAVRSQTVFTGSPKGEVTFRVNSGTTGDIYRVWMGDICVFSAGPAFQRTTRFHNNTMMFLTDLKQLTELKQNFWISFPGHDVGELQVLQRTEMMI